MTSYGLTLSSEEHAPRRLVEMAGLAEEHGFDFVSISDHFHPWITEQGHSPFVWAVLGAIAQRTSTIAVGVGVTCPIMRIHPVILAQATATTGQLLDGRFTWGVGTGEALNEHITGERWPIAPDRIDMLEEAIELVRLLWTGDEVTFDGDFFTVENARIFDPPSSDDPDRRLGVRRRRRRRWPAAPATACGPAATPRSSRHGARAGGSGPVYSQVNVCWEPRPGRGHRARPPALAEQRRARAS